MQFATVAYEVENAVARVVLNRPESLNALDAAMGADLASALKAATAAEEVRAVLLTGAGSAFCAGGDLKAMAAGLEAAGPGTQRELGAILRNFHEVMRTLYTLDLPVVAALHGPVVGAGFSIALACDFRVAADNATFSQAFIRLGLTPDGGATFLLPRLVGPSRAADLMMTGKTIDARTAYAWGIVSLLTPPEKDVTAGLELAQALAVHPRGAMRELKRLLRSSERNSFAEQLEAEGAAQVANAGTPEFHAALRAFLARGR